MRKPKTQADVINTLEPQAIKAVDRVRARGMAQISQLWSDAKDQMKLAILHEYHRDFGADKWSLGIARAKGTLLRIERHISNVLNQFQADSTSIAAKSFRSVYREGVLRHAWILDQVTPESYDVNVPVTRMMRESAIQVYTGAAADQAWRDRWSNWLGAYQSALNQNIKLGAINASGPHEAADEVDDTKAGTPAYYLEDALSRVYQYQALSDYSQGITDLSESNPDMELEEIWQTRYNARVCDDCDANKGLTMDEADGDIPLHPNCECYWRLVPASFAELLQSGDIDDVELAKEMDGRNLVPDAMIIRNEAGEPAAKIIVSFEKWAEGFQNVIGTGAR